MRSRLAQVVTVCIGLSACGPVDDNGVLGTVDPGDNFIAPDLQLDEAFFYCRIQPEVLTEHSCAGGLDGEGGSCHDSRSALRLLDAPEPSPCDDDGVIVDTVPDSYRANLEAVRFSVQSDPLSSPLYLRPINRAAHPREIYDAQDEAAELVFDWISAGAQ
ncbi:MAG: hypothetical protein OXT09_19105 [Myxococcales bacterium]|nr:hypothetical protein [Myxococcales bacterium]